MRKRLRPWYLIKLREKSQLIFQRLSTKRSLKNIESNTNFSKKCRGKFRVRMLILSRCLSSHLHLLKCRILELSLLSSINLKCNSNKFQHFKISFQLLLFNIKQ
jgi:hypothetical protein